MLHAVLPFALVLRPVCPRVHACIERKRPGITRLLCGNSAKAPACQSVRRALTWAMGLAVSNTPDVQVAVGQLHGLVRIVPHSYERPGPSAQSICTL